jgi:predicted MFS family arabinose efflux permease
MQHSALWTKDFILVFVSNLLLFFSFYLLIPVLPFYLMEELKTSGSLAGVVLSLYTVSALLIRPFSGFMVDMFSRKPLYLICYGCFCAIFAGYVVASTLLLFIVLRILHGFSFGISTVSGSTLAVDLMTPERRGEGIGYYGMAANIAMAVGPVAGLWVYEHYSFDVLFLSAFAACATGFACITIIRPMPIKKEHHAAEARQSLSFDRFILLKALPCVALLFIAGMGYGAVLNYVGLYSATASFGSSAGIFFTLISVGIVLARILSAKAINGGKIIQMTYVGGGFLIVSFVLFALCANAFMLYLIAFLLGMGFGYLNPAFQSMFINLGGHHQRGTANATYFTFWDFGIGTGTATGGLVIERLGFEWLYGLCAGLLVLGVVYFAKVSASCYRQNKLR